MIFSLKSFETTVYFISVLSKTSLYSYVPVIFATSNIPGSLFSNVTFSTSDGALPLIDTFILVSPYVRVYTLSSLDSFINLASKTLSFVASMTSSSSSKPSSGLLSI